MPTYKLTMADKTQIDVGLCGTYSNLPLYIEIVGLPFFECVALFDDPEKTKRLEYDTGAEQIVYEGYTELFSAKAENGFVNVGLRKSKGE